jgi:hypothetical protein
MTILTILREESPGACSGGFLAQDSFEIFKKIYIDIENLSTKL